MGTGCGYPDRESVHRAEQASHTTEAKFKCFLYTAFFLVPAFQLMAEEDFIFH